MPRGFTHWTRAPAEHLTYQTIPGSSIEIVRQPNPGSVTHALFDLDGTLSMLRDGWQDFMVPMMVEALEECDTDESPAQLEALVKDFVDQLTGKQTIYQMIRLAEEVDKRGGAPDEPLEYKARYYEKLQEAVARRKGRIRSGEVPVERFLVPGSIEVLKDLNRRGVKCYLASGTDEPLVQEDCELLGIAEHLSGGIFGAQEKHHTFSKAMVIERILQTYDLKGPELLVVGDGYVEIENGVDVGATTFGVHTHENNRYHMNARKRDRLIAAGAHFLAPDLENARQLLDRLGI